METNFKISDKPGVKAPVTPEHIMQIGLGYWASKTLLAAIDFQLFTLLAEKPLTGKSIREKLKLHVRSYDDFLDTLVALQFLKREGIGEMAEYSNAPDTDLFLDRKKPSYIGGILEMGNNRLYGFWGNLEEALVTGLPQNEIKDSPEEDQFSKLYADPVRMKEFLVAMSGIQMGAFISFAEKFDFSNYKTLVDAGGAMGSLCMQVVKHQSHMKCISYDLAAVAPVAKEFIKQTGVSDKVEIVSGSFFDKIPNADVVVMGNILHDWSEKEKLILMKKAYDALPKGGAFVCIENIIDDDRRKNVFGLLMSLNMLIETKEGKDYTFKEFSNWAGQAGFVEFELIHLGGPTSAAIAFK